jgi:hypothetical protein
MLRKAMEHGIVPNKTQEARDWFRKKALNYRTARISTNQNKLFQGSVLTNTPWPGRMYMFTYDAKHKDTLPYWDAFPMIFVVDRFPGGFYGINLHYLQPVLRAKLMDALYMIANNRLYNDTTRLMVSYQVLKNASTMKFFKPCFKMYLTDHVKSQFIYIEPQEWDIALMLPAQKFQKATSAQVWKESASSITKVSGSKTVRTKGKKK